jgi:hypothetical protein
MTHHWLEKSGNSKKRRQDTGSGIRQRELLDEPGQERGKECSECVVNGMSTGHGDHGSGPDLGVEGMVDGWAGSGLGHDGRLQSGIDP